MTQNDYNQGFRNEWEAKIIAHAWKDQNFKNKLLRDPQAALKEFGFNLPENYKIQVIEEKENQSILVLPRCPTECQSLAEEELQKVAGANTGVNCSWGFCSTNNECGPQDRAGEIRS